MEIVRLKRTSRILSGHPWVFSNELATSPKRYEPGSLLELRDGKNNFLAIGYINPHSLIAIRVLTRNKENIDRDFFSKRILHAVGYRNRFLKDTDSFRVIYSEGDNLPGLIVDKYDRCLSVQFLTLGMQRWSEIIIDVLDMIFSPSVIVLRNDSSARLLEGLKTEKKILKGTMDEYPVIHEDFLRFEVDPLSGQKTGFFLDQRENRMAFSRLIDGGKGLDLFCYTGAWGLHMAGKGADVTGVDESDYAISQATKNAGMNGLSERCRFIKTEVFDYLKKEISKGSRYDFIVLDPPAFVKSKSKLREAMKAYRAINSNALRLLEAGGLLATSSCSYHMSRELFMEVLRLAARDAGRQVRVIGMRSQAGDHPVLLSVPETEYLKCVFLAADP